MKHAFYAAGFLTLCMVLVSCGKGGNSGVVQNPTAAAMNFENDPSGTWEYEYIPSQYYNGKFKLVVTKGTLQFNGKTYFKVEQPYGNDKSLRAIRIHREDGSLKIDWVIEKNAAENTGALGIEQGAILKVDGAQLSLGDYKGNPFATMTKK
jgi:hypothetical protein